MTNIGIIKKHYELTRKRLTIDDTSLAKRTFAPGTISGRKGKKLLDGLHYNRSPEPRTHYQKPESVITLYNTPNHLAISDRLREKNRSVIVNYAASNAQTQN